MDETKTPDTHVANHTTQESSTSTDKPQNISQLTQALSQLDQETMTKHNTAKPEKTQPIPQHNEQTQSSSTNSNTTQPKEVLKKRFSFPGVSGISKLLFKSSPEATQISPRSLSPNASKQLWDRVSVKMKKQGRNVGEKIFNVQQTKYFFTCTIHSLERLNPYQCDPQQYVAIKWERGKKSGQTEKRAYPITNTDEFIDFEQTIETFGKFDKKGRKTGFKKKAFALCILEYANATAEPKQTWRTVMDMSDYIKEETHSVTLKLKVEGWTEKHPNAELHLTIKTWPAPVVTKMV